MSKGSVEGAGSGSVASAHVSLACLEFLDRFDAGGARPSCARAARAGALPGVGGKVDHVAEAFIAQQRYAHRLDEAKRSRVVQTLRERRLGAVDIAKVLAKNEEMHGGRILNHHFTDVHQLNQDGFTGGWPSGITDSRLPSLRDKPFDENGFQMLDNLGPLLPGEETHGPMRPTRTGGTMRATTSTCIRGQT